jgi:hypothetical protein
METAQNKTEIVAEIELPALKQEVFSDFVVNVHRRGLRLIAGRKRIKGGVGEAERIVQEGVREMLGNGAPPPRFRDGFGRPKPMARAVVAMRPRVQGEAA